MTTESQQVAVTILEQLGGNKFRAMTGAKNFLSTENSLTFTLPSNFAKHGINRVRVTLAPSDTYTVEFFKVRGTTCKRVAEVSDVYNDRLQPIFTNLTGLDTSL